jgi:hypothetical protein
MNLRRSPSIQLLAGLLAASMLATCGGTAASAEPSTPSPLPSAQSQSASPAPPTVTPAAPSWSPPSTPVDFISERYGYRVRLPAGWYVREEGPGEWTVGEISYAGAGTDAFEEDYPGRGGAVADYPGVTQGLYVSAADANGVALSSWTDELAKTMDRASSCHGEPEREEFAVDGEPAELLVYDRSDCVHDHHVLVVGVLRADAGFALLWLARKGASDARRGDFEEILSTFTFVG